MNTYSASLDLSFPRPSFLPGRLLQAVSIGAVLLGSFTRGQDWPQVSLTSPVGGFDFPVHITHAGDGSGRLFVVELGGRIRIVKNGQLLAAPFLDISDRVGANQGLLSVAFPPNYSSTGHFYVNYTDKDSYAVVIARYSVTADADVASAPPRDQEQRVLEIPTPHNFGAIFHSGGELAFGPGGYLFVGVGDGDMGDDPGDIPQISQRLDSYRGKILRLDVETGNPATYTVPPGNPFVNTPGALPLIWAVGVRNPWRSSFDRLTQDFYIGDVGQSAYEEINVQLAGTPGGINYGWPIMEGPNQHAVPLTPIDLAGLTPPTAGYVNTRPTWVPSDPNAVPPDCSVTGGRVYRGTTYPRMKGVYIYGDYFSGKIFGLRRQDGVWQTALLRDRPAAGQPPGREGLISFGEDESGEIYVTDSWAATIYKLSDSVTNTRPVASGQTLAAIEDTPLNVTLSGSDADGNSLTYTVVNMPSHGTLNGTAPNLTYTPADNYSGSDSFTFKVNDGIEDSTAATITLNLAPRNDPPIAFPDTATTKKNKAVVIAVLANDTDVDGDPLSVGVAGAASIGTTAISKDKKSVEYTPARNFTGNATFSYTVIDGKGGSASASVTVSVNAR